MNILFLMGTYPSYGGVEKVSTYLSNEFIKRGHSVSIVSFEQPNPEIAEKELDPLVTLHFLSYPVSKKENLEALRNIITTEKIDFIISQWAVPYYVARLCHHASRNTGCKLITVHHNRPDTNAKIKDIEIAIESGKGPKLLNAIKLFAVRLVSRLSLRYVYNSSDRYVVLSESFKQIARNYMWLSQKAPVLALSNPITIPLSDVDYSTKINEIICVGRIEYNQKRTYRLIDVWKIIQKKHPSWQLTFVGDGPDRKDLETRIKESGLKNITITGFTDPKPYYSRARILAMISDYEGMPLVLAEGMAHGVIPVVLDTFSSSADLIPDESIGCIVDAPYDTDRFSAAILKVMSDAEKLETMSRNAQKYSGNYTLRTIADKWEELFAKLSNNTMK